MGADYSKMHRLMRLLTLMQSGEAGNAAELARTLGVVERTIYRDLDILTDLGIPCHFDESAGGYRVRRDFFLPPMHFTAGETLALLALVGQVAADEQIALVGPAAQAVEKIRAQVPSKVRDEVGDLHEHVDIQLPATGPDSEVIRDVFGDVQRAIQMRRALRCRYQSVNSEGESTPFLLHPHKLSFDQRAWYVIGHHCDHDGVRRLKLNRFTAIEPTAKPYMIPDDFSLETYRGKAWRMILGDRLYRVVITFNATVAETLLQNASEPTGRALSVPMCMVGDNRTDVVAGDAGDGSRLDRSAAALPGGGHCMAESGVALVRTACRAWRAAGGEATASDQSAEHTADGCSALA